MIKKNVSIKEVKPGIKNGESHDCEDYWVISQFEEGTPDNIYEYQRICEKCGRVEKVVEKLESRTFKDVYKQFHEI
ncbi:hypothetical protein [Lutispora sp.]|uniref:hypothetical protein n=1 Tax=Lutispora sp. TaxID=2828727 RepID=UPI003562D2A4